MNFLHTNHGVIQLPAFFPDATLAHVRALDTQDLINAKVQGIVVNAYHLHKLQKGSLIKKMGGIHAFMNWERPVITDSGGWQIMSLIHDNPGAGRISEDGPIFFDPDLKTEIHFTPEKSIQLQAQLNPDIMICLDNCTRHDVSIHEQIESVENTINWAKRCKEEFIRLTHVNKQSANKKPRLFAVIQGGNSKELRKKCAVELLKIAFDGFSFGGHPVNSDGKLVVEILKYTAGLIPDEYPKYAMGVGRPEDIVKCFKMGYTMFDCVIPTREARHKKLYIWNKNLSKKSILMGNFYSTRYINPSFATNKKPIDENCDCLACQNYSRSYLYHLFSLHEPAALRLATIHNLRFYSRLMEKLAS